MKNTKKNRPVNELFNRFATVTCEIAGSLWSFIIALLLIIIWAVTGPIFKYSDTWQLIINTGTTIITFLMVFLIQHTQNRDTKILNLKLDELIKSSQRANNFSIDLDKLNDDELKLLEIEYKKLCNKRAANKS
ncbi:low affinity iron permease family protein [Legionella gresilensis]|uniref:low affinity iron permease family protein n=1 Tax=Legionella gresilensis TaxID=91823 RepID=UPI001041A7CE|nr:low affinity iron permease family protein [Legionella gresilensis]